MNAFAIGLSYVGTEFSGWQYQPDVPTVQGEVQAALSRIAAHPIIVRVAGRTDRGVHAVGQVVGFHSESVRKPEVWLRGLNGLTCDAIHAHWLLPVGADFHPRYSAVSRTYEYLYFDDPIRSPILHDRAWSVEQLDADAMHRAAQSLLGEHDFSSFRGAGCQSITPMRQVQSITVARRGHVVSMRIRANAFLLHMVRNLARALHDVGTGHWQGVDLVSLLQARDRALLGATAPPHALYLVDVAYPEQAFPGHPQLPL